MHYCYKVTKNLNKIFLVIDIIIMSNISIDLSLFDSNIVIVNNNDDIVSKINMITYIYFCLG